MKLSGKLGGAQITLMTISHFLYRFVTEDYSLSRPDAKKLRHSFAIGTGSIDMECHISLLEDLLCL